MKKPRVDRPVIVEGRYDKIKLDSILDADIFTTDGFGIFNQKEKMALFARLAAERGILVLTDADGAGRLIRSRISGCLPKERVTHLYTPAIEGKEKRKSAPSKAGLLGVEGMETERLLTIFEPYFTDAPKTERGEPITKAELYADGLSGARGSAERRAALAREMGLPPEMSANSLLAAINLLYGRDTYRRLLQRVKDREALSTDS